MILFVFGLAVGSFINVVALRYRGDHFVFSHRVIGGRSACPHCKKILHWYELIPVVSWVIQGARCRSCRARIGFQYPLVEILSGCIFAFVPMVFMYEPVLSALWIAAFELILLISYIDVRLQIIPDELTLLLTAVGIFYGIVLVGYLGMANVSFIASYAVPFGFQQNFWINRLVGIAVGAGFFALLILITRGKGMGWGDMKLGAPLGLLFGWPDIVLLYASAFISGAIAGVLFLALRKKNMKSALPFVPFLALGAALIFFFGHSAAGWYIHAIGL